MKFILFEVAMLVVVMVCIALSSEELTDRMTAKIDRRLRGDTLPCLTIGLEP